MKPEEDIKVVSISAVSFVNEGSNLTVVYGLGEDGRVYHWDTMHGRWYLYTD